MCIFAFQILNSLGFCYPSFFLLSYFISVYKEIVDQYSKSYLGAPKECYLGKDVLFFSHRPF